MSLGSHFPGSLSCWGPPGRQAWKEVKCAGFNSGNNHASQSGRSWPGGSSSPSQPGPSPHLPALCLGSRRPWRASPGQCVMTYLTRASLCVCLIPPLAPPAPWTTGSCAFVPDMLTLQRLEVHVCLCFYERITCLYTYTPTLMSVQRVWPMGLGLNSK